MPSHTPNKEDYTFRWLLAVAAVIFIFIIYLATNGNATMNVLTLTSGWMLCLLIGLAGLTILWQIWIGKIDMSSLFSEEKGGAASFSRFQFFIFTFVIAMSLFLVIVGGGSAQTSTMQASAVQASVAQDAAARAAKDKEAAEIDAAKKAADAQMAEAAAETAKATGDPKAAEKEEEARNATAKANAAKEAVTKATTAQETAAKTAASQTAVAQAIAAQRVPAFPNEIPNGILLLLGISSASFLVSKGMPGKKEGGETDGPDPAAEAAKAKEKIATLLFDVDNRLKALGDEATDDETEKQLRAALKQLKDAAQQS